MNGQWPWEWDWGEIWDDMRGIPSYLWESVQNDIRYVRSRAFRGIQTLAEGPSNGLHWSDISAARELANERYESANRFAQTHDTRDPVYGHVNARWNLADAYRHFSWMFEETVARGASSARFIGDQNEIAYLSGTLFRTTSLFSNRNIVSGRFTMDDIMDLYNNSVGIQMGACPEHEDRSSYEAFWYAQGNGWLIDNIVYTPDRLGIVPNGGINGTVSGVWNLNTNSIELTDQYGTTVNLCLYTREITH